ncbi:MAG: hypothetical protein IPH45_14725 [Bacteroidales bacterium]|nr:hypothetical protein [Bacteroidales bacterium]
MKRTIIFLFLVLSGTFLFSQQSPVMYLSIMPKYSGNSCEITDADTAKISNFQNKMSIFRESLGNDLNERKEALDNFMENNEDQIRENMLGQQGYSKEDAQKLKNADNMSEEEKMAIANQMLMDKMGMDVNDFKNLAEMDTSAQKSWAQGYGTMMMADAMANPQKNQEEQKRFKDQFDLVSEQNYD